MPGIYGYPFNRDEIESEVRDAGLQLVKYQAKPHGVAMACRGYWMPVSS